eukprot:Pompholyxophrys_punicea_v1_NODE_1493_length_686_cov_1.470681.p1 type:complete len:152 gc:universal NODE_1493_length_686_cov_1.470681:171-626(+)
MIRGLPVLPVWPVLIEDLNFSETGRVKMELMQQTFFIGLHGMNCVSLTMVSKVLCKNFSASTVIISFRQFVLMDLLWKLCLGNLKISKDLLQNYAQLSMDIVWLCWKPKSQLLVLTREILTLCKIRGSKRFVRFKKRLEFAQAWRSPQKRI